MAETIISPQRRTQLLEGSLKNLFYPPEEGEYKYFARAEDRPFLKGDRIVRAAWAADASMLCYARYGITRMSDDQLKSNLAQGGLELKKKIGGTPANWNAPGTQAFFATGDGVAVLAFRGTEADDPRDLHADVDILLVHEDDDQPAASWGHLASILHLFSAPCLVHRGFQKALNDVWDEVRQTLEEYRRSAPEAEICLTGHSLGGALALLTYSRLADANTSLYTIGCPRVGNAAFRERVAASRGKGHFRCVNFNDLVAHVPLEDVSYRHAPQACYRFDKAGALDCENDGTVWGDLADLGRVIGSLPADLRTNVQKLNLPAPLGLVDHSPARYCMRLWDCV